VAQGSAAAEVRQAESCLSASRTTRVPVPRGAGTFAFFGAGYVDTTPNNAELAFVRTRRPLCTYTSSKWSHGGRKKKFSTEERAYLSGVTPEPMVVG
jgi:hypothetical protein